MSATSVTLSSSVLGQPVTQVKTDPQVVAKLAQILEKSGLSIQESNGQCLGG